MFETSREKMRNSGWRAFCCRAFALLVVSGPVLAGDEGAWSTMDEVKMGKDPLRLVLSFHNGDLFKGCSKFTIEIEKYAWFKWDVQARLIRRQRPERKMSLPELRAQLFALQHQSIYVAENIALKRLDRCRFGADAAVLKGNVLNVYFKM